MGRNYLGHSAGDAINAVLAAVAQLQAPAQVAGAFVCRDPRAVRRRKPLVNASARLIGLLHGRRVTYPDLKPRRRRRVLPHADVRSPPMAIPSHSGTKRCKPGSRTGLRELIKMKIEAAWGASSVEPKLEYGPISSTGFSSRRVYPILPLTETMFRPFRPYVEFTLLARTVLVVGSACLDAIGHVNPTQSRVWKEAISLRDDFDA